MSAVIVSKTLRSPLAKVWTALSDFGGVHHFSAGVQTSPINDGTPDSGVGAERYCRLYDGNHIQERVTESVEMKRLSLEVFDTSMPIRGMDATFDLAPAPGGGTVVTVTLDYTLKYGPLGAAMNVLVMRRAMKSSFNGLLAGLDHHLITGEEISEGWKPTPLVAS